MSRWIATLAAISLFVGVGRAEMRLYSYAFSKQYVVTISDDALQKSPAWAEEAENPPVSARKAIKLADGMKDSLVKDSKDFKWTLRSASLQPAGAGKWFWLVYYEAEFQGVSTGIPNYLRLVVLMDGTVIKPDVKENK